MIARTVARIVRACLGSAAAAGICAYPATPRIPVTDHYYGTAVVDPYRWIENANDPRVSAWVAKQDALTLSYLKAQPAYPHYLERVAQLDKRGIERGGLEIAGPYWFYFVIDPNKPQPILTVREGLSGSERTLYDPNRHRDAGGSAPSIESVFVAPDGRKVAFTTQSGGSEEETLHVVDVADGTMLDDVIPHVGGGTTPTAVAWDPGDGGFIHTQFPHEARGVDAHFGIALYHHVLGTDPASDTYVFGRTLPKTAEMTLQTSSDGQVTALSVTAGDGVHASVYLRTGNGPFHLAATPADDIGDSADPKAAFVNHDYDVITTKNHDRGEIRAIAPDGTFATSALVVPASRFVIEGLHQTGNAFVTRDLDGGDGAARMFAPGGTPKTALPIPPISTVSELASDATGTSIVVGYETYSKPDTWLRYDPRHNSFAPTGIANPAPAAFSRVVTRRVFVPSLDGRVKIPLEIVSLPGAPHDGSAPTILTAYGSYGLVTRPFFIGSQLAWLERGGVFAQAMIRGGGEYGESWHLAAQHATKTKSADDLAACALWLESHGYGDRRHLGIEGGSAGGFLMGLAFTRNPSIYRAVVSFVGFYDLLRTELTPNGRFNTPEFGTVTDPKQFAWMVKQSPYQNVRPGIRYPAILMPTGANDPRVTPWESRKMIAKLQADSASHRPALLLEQAGQGHGIGNSLQQRIEGTARTLTFFDSQLR